MDIAIPRAVGMVADIAPSMRKLADAAWSTCAERTRHLAANIAVARGRKGVSLARDILSTNT